MTNIHLTGASGTGKTTVGNALERQLKMKHPESVSRSCPFPITTQKAQNYISLKTFEQGISSTGSVIDRTILDCAAYNTAFKLSGLEIDLDRVKLFAATDPFVIYFPIYWPAEDDGFRPVSPALNRVVDNYIVYLLNTNHIKYITVWDEPVESRVEHIISEWEQRNGNGNQAKK